MSRKCHRVERQRVSRTQCDGIIRATTGEEGFLHVSRGSVWSKGRSETKMEGKGKECRNLFRNCVSSASASEVERKELLELEKELGVFFFVALHFCVK